MPLIVEMSYGGSAWARAGVLNPGDQPGSLSNCRSGVRELLVFACDGDWSAVWLAAGASDLELADERLIVADGLDELASLTEGESFEREVTTGRGRRCRVRWRHAG